MTLKDILEQAKNMDIIAARDRDSFDTPWRRVMLQKLSANIWLLLNEKGEVLDEPEDSCPSSGFSKETLFAEVGMEYYDFPIDKVDAQSNASDKLPTAGARSSEDVAGSSSAGTMRAGWPPSIASCPPPQAFAPTMSSPKASAPKAPVSKASTRATKVGGSLNSHDDDDLNDEALNAAADAAVALNAPKAPVSKASTGTKVGGSLNSLDDDDLNDEALNSAIDAAVAAAHGGGGSRTASDKAAPDSAAAGTNKAAADKAAADKAPADKAVADNAAAGGNNWHDKMDLARARRKSDGQTGTIRTRDGSKDMAIPANKVLFIYDNSSGGFTTMKQEEMQSDYEFLGDEVDPTPVNMRPCQLIRSRKHSATVADGVFLGRVDVNFSAPPGSPKDAKVDELEAFCTVKLDGVTLALGNRVTVDAATAPQRPKKEFYMALILRCSMANQYRYNALIYCAEDKVIVQVGLSNVLLDTVQHEMSSKDKADMMNTIRNVRLANFQIAQRRSSAAEKDAKQARDEARRKNKEARMAEKEEKAKEKKAEKAGRTGICRTSLLQAGG
eukprot:jgi/Chrpa1/15752/Chrysochromulina_OHIO_Genome00026249-RA